VQQALMKIVEGAVVNVTRQGGRKYTEKKMIQVNTQDILFICGGAFDGIEKKIASRVRANAIGYGLRTGDEIDRDNLLQYIAPQDLKSFGLIPELVGRLPVLTYLDPLNRKVLRSILTDPKNAIIKQYVRLFEMDNIELKIEEKVFDFIVDRAIEFKLGARGLRSICEMIMLDAMFEIPTSAKKAETFEITLEYAENKISKTQMRKLKVA